MSGTAAQNGFVEFEQLVSDLLIALGFENVTLLDNTDWGVDFQAYYVTESQTGEKTSQLWLIEIKHYSIERNVDLSTIARLSAILKVKQAAKALLITSSNLTSAALQYLDKFNASIEQKLEVWSRDKLIDLLAMFPQLEAKYKHIISGFPLSLSTPSNELSLSLKQRLLSCPPGKEGWRDFEDICTQILTEVFVPPLKPPKPQPATLNRLERRDVLFSLRDADTDIGWAKICRDFDSKFLLCEFKNYVNPCTKDQVNQTRNYLKETIGRLGILFSRKGADSNAYRMRNSIYSQDKKVILLFDDKHLIELLQLKAANQNPLDLIRDAIDDFYISYE
jgi:hypothetical protein